MPSHRTRGVRVLALAANDDGRLRPGQLVTVTIGVDERAGAAIIMAEPAPMRAAKTNFLKIPPSGYFYYWSTGGRTTTPSKSRGP